MGANEIETLQFNCTTCPSECLLTVEVERGADGNVIEVRSVTGNSCPRGDTFAHQELTCPMRVLTTTVAVSGGDEALRRIAEGAAMIRTKGEPGTGDVIQAVRHMRTMNKQIRELVGLRDDEVYEAAKQLAVPYDLAKYVHDNGRLPVVNFAAGGVATPADAALMMELGAEGVFVGSGIFKSGDPAKRAAAIVKAVANFTDAKLIAELSEDLGEAMVGINADEIEIIMEERGR